MWVCSRQAQGAHQSITPPKHFCTQHSKSISKQTDPGQSWRTKMKIWDPLQVTVTETKEWRCLCLDMFNVSICLAYAEVSWGFLSQLFQFFPLLQSARQVIQRCHRCRNRPASRLPIGTSQNLNSMAVQRPPPWRPLENKVSSNLKALSIFWPPTRQESCVFRERFSPGMCLKKRNA